MADRAFLQMDQAASEDKKVLGYVRKRSSYSDILCNYSLLHDGHCAEKMNVERSIYEMLQIVSVSLTDATPLKDLFAKPSYNIVNELDGSTEPTLF